MEENSEKLLFRMQNIIPRGFSSASQNITATSSLTSVQETSALDGPLDFVMEMTFGKIAGEVWGPVDGKPVIAIHGWLDNAATFHTLFPLLPKNLRIVSIEIPGHGFSDPFPADIAYNFYDCLLAIERVTKQLKWDKFSFICHSLGGAMSILYAGIFPEKVDKMVCLDIVRPTPTIPETVGYRLRKTVGVLLKAEEAIKAGPEKPCSYDTAVKRNIRGTFGSLDEKACDILFKRGLKKVDGGFIFRRDRRLIAAPLSFTPKEDIILLAKEVTAKMLLIKFTEGPYFEEIEPFMEQVEALKTNSKSFRYVEVPGKHHVHLTEPEKIAPMICEFFNE